MKPVFKTIVQALSFRSNLYDPIVVPSLFTSFNVTEADMEH
ncbi:hypothetical protein [Rhizobium sp.]|jgi:hypothetical protein